MRQQIVVFIICLLGFFVQGQSISPAAVTGTASNMSQSNGSISFTVGQLVVKSQTDADGNILGSGFSASSVTIVGINKVEDEKILDVNVFPNPSNALVNVQVKNTTLKQMTLTLTDLQGKTVFN